MRRSQRDLPVRPDQMRDARLGELERSKRRQGGPKDPNPISQNAEPLRIIRGRITTGVAPGITTGSGFTVGGGAVGQVTVTFTTAFSGVPSVTLTPERTGAGHNMVADLGNAGVLAGSFSVICTDANAAFATADCVVNFQAIGPA